MPHSDQTNRASDIPQSFYDAYYYKTSCGLPYERSEPWLTRYATIAETIILRINPRTVLDVGCAQGFLVETLRDRGVEAFGFDISEYAIGQIREDIRPYCWVASVLDPFPQRYDYIACIEVLEHLPRTDAELAVANLCKYADDILFSSTPDDFAEATHFNVQPVEYWAELFARQGFYRDLDFDATFIAKHAMRFCKASGPLYSIVKAYERKLWAQFREIDALRPLNLELLEERKGWEAQLIETTQEKLQLQGQLGEVAQEKQILAMQMGQLIQEKQALEVEYAESAQGKHRLEEEKYRLEEEKYRLEEEKYRLEEEKHRLEGTINKHHETIDRLQISIDEKDEHIGKLEWELNEIQSSLGWRFLYRYNQVKKRCLPPGSKRRAGYELALKAIKIGFSQGWRVVLQNAAAKLQRKIPLSARRGPTSKEAGFWMDGRPGRGWGSRVLIINGSLLHVERYRCYHTQEQLQLYRVPCEVRYPTDTALLQLFPDYDLVILHRLQYSKPLEEIVHKARANKAIILLDIDDLVFDPDLVEYIEAFRSTAQAAEEARRYRRALELCDGALVTTESLVRAVAKVGKPAWIHRNALSFELLEVSERAVRGRKCDTDKVVIGYASGTRTHNRDFKEVEAALQRILQAHPEVELWIMGYLDLDEGWAVWEDRIKRIPFVPWRELPQWLAEFDINLAPLELGNPFCEAKSELKYVESAAVGVPTVASKVGAFEFAIRHGENGLLAEHTEEWVHALEQLIVNPKLRREMGACARADVLRRYHPVSRGAELVVTLDEMVRSLRGKSPMDEVHPIEPQGARDKLAPSIIFKEHEPAHALLDGLTGLEIGAAAHNPFGLRTRNVALPEGYEFYAEHQRRDMGVAPAVVDIWAAGDNIPVPNGSQDFVVSSHVIEHLPNVIAALLEWDRIVRDGGYVFMIVPWQTAIKPDRTTDESRELTTLAHFVEDYSRGLKLVRPVSRHVWRLVCALDGWLVQHAEVTDAPRWLNSCFRSLRTHALYGQPGLIHLLRRLLPWDPHDAEAVPDGAMGHYYTFSPDTHYHIFTPDSLLEVVEWMCRNRLCDWRLVVREDIDSKIGSGDGFTLAFQVRHAGSSARG